MIRPYVRRCMHLSVRVLNYLQNSTFWTFSSRPVQGSQWAWGFHQWRLHYYYMALMDICVEKAMKTILWNVVIWRRVKLLLNVHLILGHRWSPLTQWTSSSFDSKLYLCICVFVFVYFRWVQRLSVHLILGHRWSPLPKWTSSSFDSSSLFTPGE